MYSVVMNMWHKKERWQPVWYLEEGLALELVVQRSWTERNKKTKMKNNQQTSSNCTWRLTASSGLSAISSSIYMRALPMANCQYNSNAPAIHLLIPHPANQHYQNAE